MKIKIKSEQERKIMLVTGEIIELTQGDNELEVTPLLAERLGKVEGIEICEEVKNEEVGTENSSENKNKKGKTKL